MKSYKRVASAVLGMAMAASCMAPITAFAAEDFQQPTDNTVIANHPNDETMLHSTPRLPHRHEVLLQGER